MKKGRGALKGSLALALCMVLSALLIGTFAVLAALGSGTADNPRRSFAHLPHGLTTVKERLVQL